MDDPVYERARAAAGREGVQAFFTLPSDVIDSA